MDTTILLLHTLSTIGLFGLIWFVQVVHYPLFVYADRKTFSRFAEEHQVRTSFVVIPLMLTELVTATLLAVAPPDGASSLTRAGLALLLMIWASTVLLQVRQHRSLLSGFSHGTISRLTRTNLLRTLLWSARSWIAVLLLSGEITS